MGGVASSLMSRRSGLVLVALPVSLAALVVAAAGAASRSTPLRPPAFVVVAAKREAAALGDPRPTSAVYVLTRRQAATHASSGASVNSNQPVYLIVLTGSFTTGQVGPAPGRRVHGTVATEVLDARTGQDTDFGVGQIPVSTAQLGVTGNLLPYLNRSKRPVCGVPDLHGSANFQGATGSQLGGLTISNTSSLSCTLPRRAAIAILWHKRPLAIERTPFPPGWLAQMYPHWSTSVHLLKPGQRATVLLQWFNWCGPTPWSGSSFRPTIELRLPGQPVRQSTTTRDAMAAPFCNARPARGSDSTLRVSPFLPPA
jgi:hypothetical protein